MIAEILERTRKARGEIGRFIADEVASPHIAGMSLQDIARVEIRPELYDQLLIYAIDHGRSVNALVDEILTKDLPASLPAVVIAVPEPEPEPDPHRNCDHEGLKGTRSCVAVVLYRNSEPELPQPQSADGKFVTRRVRCNHGGWCPSPFHWRELTRCGCPMSAPIEPARALPRTQSTQQGPCSQGPRVPAEPEARQTP